MGKKSTDVKPSAAALALELFFPCHTMRAGLEIFLIVSLALVATG